MLITCIVQYSLFLKEDINKSGALPPEITKKLIWSGKPGTKKL